MSDITANVVVSMPSQLFTMARSFKAVANGEIYIGKIDTDPVNPENRIQVYVENEDGSHVPVSQPIIINAAGYPVYNGQIAKFVTVQGHSMAVYDAYGAKQFYFPNVLKYDPDQLRGELSNKLIYVAINIEQEDVPDIFNHVMIHGRYVYESSTPTLTPDGILIIRSRNGRIFELKKTRSIYASDFCNDAQTLQKAYESAASIGAEFIIDKSFEGLMAVNEDPFSPGNDAFKSVLRCVDNSAIRFEKDGALKLANQNRPQSHIIYIANGVKNVNIYNPVLEGDRLTNTSEGEHGWGLTILQSSNIRVIGGTFTNMFGDGIYIGMKWGTTDGTVPRNIYIEKPVIRQCRRNGISLTSGENVLIVNPEIYNIGDYGGVTGAMPKSGIDIEPEADESVPGHTVPRLINCEISNPYINGAYTGLELNIFPNGLVADVIISGNTTLTNVTNRGVTATRVNGNGIGKILIDRVVFKTSPLDFCVFEMLGDDRLFVEIGEIVDETTIAGGDKIIRLLPRTIDPISIGVSRNFKNLVIKKCTSTISTFLVLAGISLKEYFIDIHIGKEEDNITTSLAYDSVDTGPAQIRGFIGGIATITSFQNTKLLNNTIIFNHSTNDIDIIASSTGDFRELKIIRAMTTSSPGRAIGVANIRFVSNSSEVTQVATTEFGSWIKIKNKEGMYSEITGAYGNWFFS
ncbi:phage tailspike protein [Escherichia coli]|uniref:phage tailspike protein n=2 Tax=Escherichia coli TaxID=562 RepID=UPI00300C24F4